MTRIYKQRVFQCEGTGKRAAYKERKAMPMRSAKIIISGVSPLLQNNPQTVDRFNKYAREMAKITAKKAKRTDQDYETMRDIEVRSKIFFDEKLGIYIPTTWVMASIAKSAFGIAKLSKLDIRGSLFMAKDKEQLNYRDKNKVKTPEDIVKNPDFRHIMILKQGQSRVVKAFPIFHEWSFETEVEFEDTKIDPGDITTIVQNTAKYVGFGDFRPTFGRAKAEVIHD